MPEVIARARTQPGSLRGARGVLGRVVNTIARWWRTRTATRSCCLPGSSLLRCTSSATFCQVLSTSTHSSRPYSFKDQWISELTALGSPVRPLMVTVITVHGLLGAAFAVGILRAAGQNRALRRVGWVLLAATALSIWIHPFFPMSSRWLEPELHGHDARVVDVRVGSDDRRRGRAVRGRVPRMVPVLLDRDGFCS